MNRSRIALALAALALGGLLWAEGPTPARAAGPFTKAVVKLYAGGEVVGQWEAVGEGKVEGHTFVFPVRKGVQDVEVRIQGTFSYEVQP